MSKEEVRVERKVEDPELRATIWDVYERSFQEGVNVCAQEQVCYPTPEVLAEALQDPDILKFISFVDGQPIGLCLITNNLKKATAAYVSDRFLRARFPKYAEAGKIYYVTALGVIPEKQAEGYGAKMLSEVCRLIFEEKATVAYDFAVEKGLPLTEIIQKIGKGYGWGDAKEIPLGQQVFTSLYWEHDGTPK